MPPLSSAPAASLPDRPSAEQQPISAFSRTGLFVLPILAIMGPHLGGFEAFGVNFFPYRIAVLAIIAVTLAVLPRLPWLRNKHMRHYLYVGYVWLTWAALGVIWARSQQAAIRGMFLGRIRLSGVPCRRQPGELANRSASVDPARLDRRSPHRGDHRRLGDHDR